MVSFKTSTNACSFSVILCITFTILSTLSHHTATCKSDKVCREQYYSMMLTHNESHQLLWPLVSFRFISIHVCHIWGSWGRLPSSLMLHCLVNHYQIKQHHITVICVFLYSAYDRMEDNLLLMYLDHLIGLTHIQVSKKSVWLLSDRARDNIFISHHAETCYTHCQSDV